MRSQAHVHTHTHTHTHTLSHVHIIILIRLIHAYHLMHMYDVILLMTYSFVLGWGNVGHVLDDLLGVLSLTSSRFTTVFMNRLVSSSIRQCMHKGSINLRDQD